jgi:hypothetical protein
MLLIHKYSIAGCRDKLFYIGKHSRNDNISQQGFE